MIIMLYMISTLCDTVLIETYKSKKGCRSHQQQRTQLTEHNHRRLHERRYEDDSEGCQGTIRTN